MRLSSFFFISMKTFVLSLLSFYSALAHFNSSKKPLCHDNERSALLQFKESLINNNNDNVSHFYLYDPCRSKSASWKANIDCCSWDGIKCNEKIGHVIKLDLSNGCLYGSINSSSSLFQLLHLKWLNLAYNNFNGSEIPSAIMNLSELSYLNLSGSFLSGQIPLDILNLPNLVSLDLSGNSYFEFFRLEVRQLNLENLLENSSNLKKIDLSDGATASSTPRNLVNLSNSFTFLSLRDSKFQGEKLSSIGNIKKVIHLELSSNELLDKRPTFVGNHASFSSSGSSDECFKKRKGLQILPEEAARLWSEWEIRLEILLSLFLQFVLIVFGSRRKYIPRFWIKIVVWSAYITADWIPTYALGALAAAKEHLQDDDCSTPNINFATIWASFFLWHLGGSDNITAYSLEDNDLWIRDFLASVFQVVVTVFLLLNSWSNDVLVYISIPLLIIGMIKAGERTFVLWSSSTKRFKYSLLTNPDPSPEFVKIMELDIAEEIEKDSIIKAHFLFKRFANLFAGLILGHREEIVSYNILHQKSANDAFSLVAIELGFMFDILYTKVTTIYSRLGIGFRCVCFVIFVAVLFVFSISVDKHEYQRAEISITYILIVGTIVLELYSFTLSLFSDWTKLCLLKLIKIQTPRIFKAPICLLLTNQKRWSESIGQFNLISVCLKDISAKYIGVKKFLRVDKLLDKYQNLTRKDVDVELKKLIHEQLLQKIDNSQNNLFEYDVSRRSIWPCRGENMLVNRYEISHFHWCTVEVDFDHSFLLWHIATDLCYYDDLQRLGDASHLHPNSKLSKYLSDYMLYLLLFCPSMMPKGLGESRYEATCEEARKFFVSKHDEMLIISQTEACRLLLESNNDEFLFTDRVGSHHSTLFYGCKVAKQLQAMENEGGWSNERKWGMISEFWVEMLAYAAIECEWREHGQQLKAGGELLTHVCLLMAHLGFSKQYCSYGRNI